MTPFPDPNDIELDSIGTECDWGGCNDESVAIRWSPEFNGWLPVCPRHRTKASIGHSVVPGIYLPFDGQGGPA